MQIVFQKISEITIDCLSKSLNATRRLVAGADLL
jgi:hypothetical protein